MSFDFEGKFQAAVSRFKSTVFDLGGRLKELRRAKEWVKPEKIVQEVNRLSEFTTPYIKHVVEDLKNLKTLQTKQVINQAKKHGNLGFKAARERFKGTKEVLESNKYVLQASKHIKNLFEGNKFANQALKIAGTRWGKGLLVTAGVAIGLKMLNGIQSSFSQEEVIPKKYDRGFDLMKETMTDFGSPVHMNKVASKTITPYYSSSRRGTVTNTNSIIKGNVALSSNKNAIGHTGY